MATPQVQLGIATAAHLKSTIDDIFHRYHKMAVRFNSLPVAARRSPSRSYATERFNSAAILQFHAEVPTLTAENIQVLGKGSQTKHELPVDEHCPVARSWFASLLEAQRLLTAFTQAGFPESQLAPIHAALAKALKALEKAEEWLALVMIAAEEDDDKGLHAVIEAWNIMCTDVKDTHIAPATAAKNGSFYLASRPNLQFEKHAKQRGGERQWFDVDLPLPQ